MVMQPGSFPKRFSLRRALTYVATAVLVASTLVLGTSSPAEAAACGSGSAPSAGAGTSGSPYEIATADHLLWLSSTTAVWSGKHFIQTANIDLPNCNFSPIGVFAAGAGPYFTGSYDGRGNTISGLTVSVSANGVFAGLFGATSGPLSIINVGLIDVSVSTTGDEPAGALLGCANHGLSGNLEIRNSFATGTVTASTDAGGLIGELRSWGSGTFNLIDSYSTVAVSATNTAGGLVARTVGPKLNITNSYSQGLVTQALVPTPRGLVGIDPGSAGVVTTTDTFWDTQSTGASTGWGYTPDIGAGKTTSQMKQLSTFANWDIVDGWEAFNFVSPTNRWGICTLANGGYPFLLWQYTSDPCVAVPPAPSGSSGPSTGPTASAAPQLAATGVDYSLGLLAAVGTLSLGVIAVTATTGLARRRSRSV
jgi:hypothetical protein